MLAGRTPRVARDGLNVADLCNRFLTAKKHLIDTNELSMRTFQEYYAACGRIVEVFGKHRMVDDIVALVPVLADPAAYGVTAGPDPAVDLQDALGVMIWMFEPDNGETGFEQMQPLIEPIMQEDGLWVTMGNAGRLLSDDESQLANALDLIAPLIDADPELTMLDQLGPIIGNKTIAGPLMRFVETPGVADALLTSTPLGEDPEVPLAFMGRLVVNGALEDVLALIDTVLTALEDFEAETSD